MTILRYIGAGLALCILGGGFGLFVMGLAVLAARAGNSLMLGGGL